MTLKTIKKMRLKALEGLSENNRIDFEESAKSAIQNEGLSAWQMTANMLKTLVSLKESRVGNIDDADDPLNRAIDLGLLNPDLRYTIKDKHETNRSQDDSDYESNDDEDNPQEKDILKALRRQSRISNYNKRTYNFNKIHIASFTKEFTLMFSEFKVEGVKYSPKLPSNSSQQSFFIVLLFQNHLSRYLVHNKRYYTQIKRLR
jgi:hypothetical protein